MLLLASSYLSKLAFVIPEQLNCLTAVNTLSCLGGHEVMPQTAVARVFGQTGIFSSPEHKVLKVSFCDGPLSVVHYLSVRPSVCACVRQQLLTTSTLKLLFGFWPNFTGMIPVWSPINVVQTFPVGCISWSRAQKIGFQNAIFKNLLVRNYKAQSIIFRI